VPPDHPKPPHFLHFAPTYIASTKLFCHVWLGSMNCVLNSCYCNCAECLTVDRHFVFRFPGDNRGGGSGGSGSYANDDDDLYR